MKIALLAILALAAFAPPSPAAEEEKKESPAAPKPKLGRAQATQVLNELRMIDSAMDQYAIENNIKGGAPITWANVQTYLKPGSRLERNGGKDPLGNLYVIKAADVLPQLSKKTAEAFDVAENFWDPYPVSAATEEEKKESPAAPEAKLSRSGATQVVNELRMIDSAIDQYAIENNKADGTPVGWANVVTYLKAGTRLAGSGGKDPLGNPYLLTVVGAAPRVSQKTADAYAVPATFWDAYSPSVAAEGEKKEGPGAPAAKLGQAAATEVRNDLRFIDSAMDQYAIENNKKDGDPITWANVLTYLKPGTRLANSGGKDPLGNAYIIKVVGVTPKVSKKTADAYAVPFAFWDPYLPE